MEGYQCRCLLSTLSSGFLLFRLSPLCNVCPFSPMLSSLSPLSYSFAIPVSQRTASLAPLTPTSLGESASQHCNWNPDQLVVTYGSCSSIFIVYGACQGRVSERQVFLPTSIALQCLSDRVRFQCFGKGLDLWNQLLGFWKWSPTVEQDFST